MPKGDAKRRSDIFVERRCNPDDISHRMGAVGSFMTQSINTKKLFDELQRTVRLVD